MIHVVHGALDVQNVDYARVHDILYHDIRVECDGVQQTPGFQSSDEMSYQEDPNSMYLPLLMSASVFFHPEYCIGSPERGENYHITFSDIQVTSDGCQSQVFGDMIRSIQIQRDYIEKAFS